MKSNQDLKNIASQVRRDIIRQVSSAASGHPGGSLGCADYLTILFFSIMDHDPAFNMEAKNEDVFFLSNGHISPLYYSVLARAGYFNVNELATFRQINSRLQGHPATHEGLPGIRVASGSLGQGVSVAIGMALTKRLNGDDKTVFVLTGDGELQEGQIWEAALFAAHNKVDNLVLTIDWNGQQIDGANDDVITLGDLEGKWKAFGWEVMYVDGHNIDELKTTLNNAKNLRNGKPVCILMKTNMGEGVDFMAGTHHWHGKAPNAEQTEIALSQLEETLGDY
ncbi:MAG: transketolase [Saprospiraceae bacterium]|nr:transketolase [Saprospiraceae bacterium]|tara:strand:- start:437 stop:1276 length:840 start_codon:yes stop_codon:yes gene_type:complete